ncbi:aromatic amino acid lyase [Rubrobacter taiwanensis]|jgi:phenylalanine ammonia-lyase|uniref:Aromatic amino acid lyase n=1 Tax=Rubrobacter taiwanensis TaxID=185139 RepID=A0A4R1BCP8_9ACTN|nr:aromatic amino acid ammonia-lyase [Rubrobacter taiwanensis]TCJ14830.1 aromatic amino acid lyase [Rubrobacter taiwanensis]
MTDSSAATRAKFELDGRTLTVEDVVNIARRLKNVECVLSGEALERIEASRALKQELISEELPIYGVTTGFGDSAHRQISSRKTAELQRNILRFMGCGTGRISPPEVARATILLRVNCLARGNSGVRRELVELMLAFLRHDIVPLIPERGSCGASGDLVPLSYVGSALTGHGEVLYGGEVRDVKEVLEELGLEPLELEAKEGLAITNGTSFMSAYAALAVWDSMELAFVADVGTAMASEALLGNRAHFDAFIHENKPHPGQVKSAGLIRELLAGSELSKEIDQILSGNGLGDRGYRELERNIQDKYSIRCAPHVTGVLRDTLTWVKKWVETEINSSDDNPLFDATGRTVHSGGNFYGGHVVQAMDSLKIALANVADLLDRQLELLVDEKFNNGLTPNLIPRLTPDDPRAGLHHGFKGMQLACSSMVAEACRLSGPVSVHSRSTEAHNQDKVSMGSIAARDARTIVELAQNVAAIHLIAACQALDLRGPEGMSPKTRAAYGKIRERVPFLSGDRRMERDIKEVVELIRSGRIREAVLSA